MERHSIAQRLAPALLCAAGMLATFGLVAPAQAVDVEPSTESTAENVDIASSASAGNGEGTINVNYQHEEAPLEGVVFHLYDIAKWATTGGYEPIGDFADAEKYPVSWDILSANQQTYRDLANTLAGYIQVNGTEPQLTAQSDENGQVTFDELADGLFLVVADPFNSKTLECTSAAMLVALPNIHVEAGENQRVVTIQPKSDCVVPEIKTETINVKKVWNDAGNTDRPKSIQVELLRDGESVEVVELSEENTWQHQWADLESGYDYRVVEKNVPEGYTTISDYDSSAEDVSDITITNTKPAPPVVPTPPAQTGAEIATVIAVAFAALAIGVLLIVKARKARS